MKPNPKNLQPSPPQTSASMQQSKRVWRTPKLPKLAQIGYAVPGLNNTPTIIHLPLDITNNLIQILDCYKR